MNITVQMKCSCGLPWGSLDAKQKETYRYFVSVKGREVGYFCKTLTEVQTAIKTFEVAQDKDLEIRIGEFVAT